MSRAGPSSDAAGREELAQHYADHGRVEPPAGLDRVIRARAEQAVANRSPRRTARWVGGLATAMALVLAVGVVIQQQAPQPEWMPLPPQPAVERQSAPAASISEEAAFQAPRSAAPAARAEGRSRINQSAGINAADRARFLDAAQPGPSKPVSAPQRELAEQVMADETPAAQDDRLPSREDVLTAIERGQFERASGLIETLGEFDGELAAELRARLDAALGDGPDEG